MSKAVISFIGMKRRESRHETHRLSACNFHAARRNVYIMRYRAGNQQVANDTQIVLHCMNKAFFRVKKYT